MRLVIFTAQVSPYHDARFVGATAFIEDVHVVSVVNAGDFQEFLAESLGEYTLHKLYKSREEYQVAVRSGALGISVYDILVRLKPDAIAVAGWTAPESIAAIIYSRNYTVPIIVMSESQIDDAPRSFLREFVKRRIVSQFDSALVGGPSHAKYVADLGVPLDRVHLGYNVVDNAYFWREAKLARANDAALKSKYALPDRYMLASARFIKKKNLPSLIAAFADARRRLEEIPDLVILGDGPERGQILGAIQSSGVGDRVHLLGFRSYEVLPIFYSLAEAFLHVSTSEQWGLVLNEAMASGVPVIASRPCGASRTVVQDGVSGILTGTDVASISDAIVRLFGMTSQHRMQIGAGGQIAIGYWGPERFGAGMLAAVESARNAPRRGRIGLWDRLFLSRLQRTTIDAVA